jgi:hypothetical protein
LADSHGLLHVARDHIVVLPRIAHADYMKRCGKKLAVCANNRRCYIILQFSSLLTPHHARRCCSNLAGYASTLRPLHVHGFHVCAGCAGFCCGGKRGV